MRVVRHRGMAQRVRKVILDKFLDGQPFTSEDLRKRLMVSRDDLSAVTNSLSYLHAQHMMNEGFELERVGYGTYRAVGPAVQPNGTDERKLLDDLLSAMAAAEPVLKKCAALMDAVNAMKENRK